MSIVKKVFTYQSDDYKKSLELRDKVLRQPLGLVFNEEFLAQDKTDHILALFENERILATSNMKQISETSVKMRQVAVDQSMQGKGIGKILVEFFEESAKEKGYKEIILHSRDTAILFYQSLNYKILDHNWFEEVGIQHLKMGKILV